MKLNKSRKRVIRSHNRGIRSRRGSLPLRLSYQRKDKEHNKKSSEQHLTHLTVHQTINNKSLFNIRYTNDYSSSKSQIKPTAYLKSLTCDLLFQYWKLFLVIILVSSIAELPFSNIEKQNLPAVLKSISQVVNLVIDPENEEIKENRIRYKELKCR